jgi:general secretion pathway protein C
MKHLYFILQLLLITIAAYQITGLAYQQMFLPARTGQDMLQMQSGKPADPKSSQPDVSGKDYTVITQKNLFHVLTHPPDTDSGKAVTETIETPLEKTNLALALWGTVTAESERDSWAVIENKKTGEQSLFQVGDPVEGGTIRKIARNQVVLQVNGEDQLLEVDITQKPSAMTSSSPALPEPETGLPDTEPASQPPSGTGLPNLMKQARIRPFFSNGKPDGLLLYGIRNDSVFQQIGLRNGDIIKSINGSDILSAQDAVTIYQSLDTPLEEMPDIRFTVQRRGKIQEIVYNTQNNEYTVENASDE